LGSLDLGQSNGGKMTVSVVFAIAGVVALLFGVIGGGIKAKELEVPRLPIVVRIITILAGLILIGTTIWLENKIQAPIAASEPTQLSVPAETKSPVTSGTNTQPAICVNAAQFVSETIPDGTLLKPGEEFTKTWEVKNIGTCTWEPNYKWVFVNGSMMGATAAAVDIGSVVPPGQVISIGIDLSAPSSVGTYRGEWMLQDLSGNNFGVINNKDGSYANPFWLIIGVHN